MNIGPYLHRVPVRFGEFQPQTSSSAAPTPQGAPRSPAGSTFAADPGALSLPGTLGQPKQHANPICSDG
jgi:hypothetical protein